MSVAFQDGEPVDPVKLQRLQDQITAIKTVADNAYALGSRLESDQRQVVFHVRAGVVTFENGIPAGDTKTEQVPVEWSSEYINVFTTCTIRTKSPSLNMRATLTGDLRSPSIAVYSEKAFKSDLNVHWISVASKPIPE